MPKFSVTRRVPYSVEQIFAIAGDVTSYREFIPLVKKVVVLNRKVLPDGRETFDAEMTIAYKKLRIEETSVSHVIADPVTRVVTTHAAGGSVKHVDAEWRLLDAGPAGTDIQFTVDYELNSRSLQFLLSGMFDLMVRKVMNAFEERARKLYGVRVTSS